MKYTKDNPLKVAIVGSREYRDSVKIKNFIYHLIEMYGKEKIEIVKPPVLNKAIKKAVMKKTPETKKRAAKTKRHVKK